jgi:hypothetical protein
MTGCVMRRGWGGVGESGAGEGHQCMYARGLLGLCKTSKVLQKGNTHGTTA